MWGISRAVFDSILLEAARAEGVEILQPARVEEHGQDARGTWVRVRDLRSNGVETFRSDQVIVADGKGLRPQPTGDFGIKAHFELRDVPRDAVQLFGVRGCYAGLAPIDGGLFNIACSVPRERIERAKDVEAVFLEMVAENRRLTAVMQKGTRVSPWLASPLPRFGIAKEWPAGVITLGNAAAALEPIGGEGMGLAMRSAELAANAIAACSDLNLVRRKLQTEFRQLWNRRRLIWRSVAIVVSRPRLCELAVDVMKMTNIPEQMVRWGKDAGHTSNEAPALQ
jgi:flavin-dependent dehydrogenase